MFEKVSNEIAHARTGLENFLAFMASFNESKTEWETWFELAQKEFIKCKVTCDSLESMMESLECIQVHKPQSRQ